MYTYSYIVYYICTYICIYTYICICTYIIYIHIHILVLLKIPLYHCIVYNTDFFRFTIIAIYFYILLLDQNKINIFKINKSMYR